MKITGFIPYWLEYHKSLESGMVKVGGRPVINFSIEILNSSSYINKTIIFASNTKVLDYIEDSLLYEFIKRPDYLDSDTISIETIIEEFLDRTDADIIVLLHPNSPFLTADTIDTCIKNVLSGSFDSAFSAHKLQKFAWFQGAPLNYNPDTPTPMLGEVEPVIIEQSSLYVFTRDVFQQRKKRIGNKPYIHMINHFEGHEVHTKEDREVAELIINAGLNQGIQL